jgi:hypothetical protein
MAITRVSEGTAAVGTTSLSVPLPASIAAGNLLVLVVASKYPAAVPTEPTDYRFRGSFSGGSGASGVDAGQALISVYTKRVSQAGESGNVVLTITGGNTCRGRLFQYTKTVNLGTSWGFGFAGGAQNAPGTAWAVTATTDPGLTAGDLVLACSAVNGDGAAGTTTFSAQALLASGVTIGTEVERDDGLTANGDDLGMFVSEHPIATGTAVAPCTYAATASATSGSTPAGATAFLRLREIPGLAGGDIASGVADYGQTLVETAGHNVHYNSDVFLLTEGTPDRTNPVIQNVSPAPSTQLAATTTPIQFDVIDPPAGPTFGLLVVEVFLKYVGRAQTIVVFDGADFLDDFAAFSSRTAITNGFHFSLLPPLGWEADIEMLRVRAIDTHGNMDTPL